MAINKWRHYLIGYYFFIWIDYQASSTFWNRSWLYVCSINGWVDCWEWTTRFSIGRVWKIKQQILYLVGIFQKKGIGWWCLLFNPNGLGMWLIVMRKMRNIKILLFNWSYNLTTNHIFNIRMGCLSIKEGYLWERMVSSETKIFNPSIIMQLEGILAVM